MQFGVIDTKPFRGLHHALFFAVFASAVLASLAMILYATGFVSLL